MVILRKDLLIELMSGEVVTTSAFFGLLVVIISSFSFYGGPASKRLVAAGTLWLSIAFATVLALGRAWQREREESALAGLLVAPVSRAAIFAGKSLGLMAFLAVVEAVVIPLTALLFSIDLVAVGPALVVICLLSTPGLAATGTLFGSMTVRTRARDLLLAIVLLPLLSPTLLASVAATRELFGGVPLAELGDYLKLMALFDVIFVTGGLALFGTLIES
ncbi:MAG: heme transporter [Chloroflexi bacterium CFX7]|nr:heme exporter protein CcmB [Polyangiaceae bacterium]MCE7926992.1 heme transporter [Chloroflexi bacterium CFX7]